MMVPSSLNSVKIPTLRLLLLTALQCVQCPRADPLPGLAK